MYAYVCVCVCVHLMHIFSDTVSLHVTRKVPMALAQYGARKDFVIDTSLKSNGVHLHIVTAYEGAAVKFIYFFDNRAFYVRVNNKLNSTRNMTQCKVVSCFLFSLHKLPKTTVTR